MKLKYLIPIAGNYFLYNDIIKNKNITESSLIFKEYIKFDYVDYIPIIGVIRLRNKIKDLDKKIVWLEQTFETTLQVWDCKMDKIYKHITKTNKE